MRRAVRAVAGVTLAMFLAACGGSAPAKPAGPAGGSEAAKAAETQPAMPGVAASGTQAGGVLGEIKKRGKIVIATEAAFEPFEFIQDGKIVGYDKDLLDFIFKDLGVQVEQLDVPFQGILAGLLAKKYDFVGTALMMTPERVGKYLFTLPTMDGSLGILKRKGDNSIGKPEDLKGKVVATQLNAGGEPQVMAFNEELKKAHGQGFKEHKRYPGYPEAYQDLAAGRVDAVVNSMPNLGALVKKQPDTFELVGRLGGPAVYFGVGVARPEDGKDLIEYINGRLMELRRSGQLAELQKKWFGYSVELPTENYLPAPKN